MKFLMTVLFLLVAVPAFAQNADFERDVLRSIDTVPTRAQLDANFPQARAQLEAAALDTKHEMWIRHRAITLLSHYPDVRSRAFLGRLLDDPDHHVRRMAVYTLGRTFGQQADTELLERLGEVLRNDPSEEVVKWAIRSLRWVHHPEATRLLTTLAKRDDVKGRIAALALKRTTYKPAAAQ